MTTVYRAYNAAGRLLYVGIAEDVWQRMQQHQTSPWVDDLAALDVEHYSTRAEARAAEREAIATEWPLWNVHGAVDGRMMLRVRRQRERERMTAPVLTKHQLERHFERCDERSSRVHRITREAMSPGQVAWERAHSALVAALLDSVGEVAA